jgi:Icc-related predicted phosphoesterase
MRLLAFSDLHRDVAAARSIVERSIDVDVVIGAGDFAVQRRRLADVIDVLRAIEKPCVLVAGNAESEVELGEACAGWPAAHVLHGSGVELGAVRFYGLGGAVPITPFGAWSYDIEESEAAHLLRDCPPGGVLVSHSPPLGHADRGAGGERYGSTAVLAAIRRARPKLVVCGHIHDSWGEESMLGPTRIINAGPVGVVLEI